SLLLPFAVMMPVLMFLFFFLFFFYAYGDHLDLHSFPTRRSSDLIAHIHTLLQNLKNQRKCILLASHSALDIAQACDMVYTFQQRSEEHTSELQSRFDLVCRLLLEKKNQNPQTCQVLQDMHTQLSM